LASRAPVSPNERALLRLLDETGYFAREERLARLASFCMALAFSIALIFLTNLPWEGMRPLVVHFRGFWFRYSVIGDLALFLASCHRARLTWGGRDSLLPSLLALLALAHACTSWHDPWGIFFSNALIEFLLISALPIFLYPHLASLAPRLARIMRVFFAAALGCIACAALLAHFFGILGFTAPILPLRLAAALRAGHFFVLMRWGAIILSLAAIALYLYLVLARERLDPELVAIRERAFRDA